MLIDGRAVYEYTDAVVLAAGQVGFWGTSAVSFDDYQTATIAPALPMALSANGSAGSVLSPAWQITAGTFAVQDQQILAGNALATAYYGPAGLGDVAVQADYSLQANQSVSLLTRYTGAGGNGYQARLVRNLSGLVTTASVVQILKGKATTLASVGTDAHAGLMRFEVQGNLLRLFIDGVLKVQAINSLLRLPGQIGMSLGAHAKLENFSVQNLPPLPVNNSVFTDNFDRTPDMLQGPDWLVRRGILAIEGDLLVGQAAVNIGLWQGASLLNAEVSAQVNLTTVRQSVSLLARYTDNFTYYEARLVRNADGSATASLFRVSNGVATLRGSVKQSLTQGVMSFSVVGNILTLSLDSSTLLNLTDTALAGPGLIGVSLGINTSLDDFTVTAR